MMSSNNVRRYLFLIIFSSYKISGHKSKTQRTDLQFLILEIKIETIATVIGLVAKVKTMSYFFFLKINGAIKIPLRTNEI